ncbi:MAG: malonyl-CoA decarboxylase [Usitatibacter sp.]
MSARILIDRIVGSLVARPRGVRRADRLTTLLRTLISERGEATGAVLARRAVALYRGLDAVGRDHFFQKLARDFAPDGNAVLRAAVDYHANPSPAHLAALQRVAEPTRQEIFRRMNMAPGGTEALIEMRRELLAAIKDHPELEAVDHDLTHLLGSWFNRGFLELRRIDWGTPAAILEKLIEYEAVHQIQGFPDLKRRLERDRRCFAFFHPALKDEPLIFVEVAFVNDLPAEVAPILAMESAVGDPRRARCAVFYSITSCQPGLRGISFGNFLIKQVAQDLHAELPNLKIFATLSPIPGLRAWVAKKLGAAGAIEPGREKLESLAAWYLTREWNAGHVPDPVARFHLGNGARLERLNWMADASERGKAQSFGLMVNYVYDLGDVERNHEEYVKRHRVVSSGTVQKQAEAAAAWIEKVPGTPISSS